MTTTPTDRARRSRKATAAELVLLAAAKLQATVETINGDSCWGWHVPASDDLLNALAELADAHSAPDVGARMRRIGLPRCERVEYPNGDSGHAQLCGTVLNQPATGNDDRSTLCDKHARESQENRVREERRLRDRLALERTNRLRIWQEFSCRTCGRAAGQECATNSGNPTASHSARVRDAGQALTDSPAPRKPRQPITSDHDLTPLP